MGVNWPGRPVSFNPVIGCGGDGLPCEQHGDAGAVVQAKAVIDNYTVLWYNGGI